MLFRSDGIDISDPSSIEAMYEKVGDFDAVVSAAGDAHFAPLSEQTDLTLKVGDRKSVV